MKGISIGCAAELCGGKLNTGSGISTEINKIVIDTRKIEENDLFAAFKGEKTDGHDYIARAFELGAACCLVSRIPEGETRPLILVDDVEKAMELICAGFRKTLDIPVIGITGSVGKTSAKEMISSVLSQRLNVHRTEGNLNNTLGVPLTLSGIRPEHEAAVIEMGISGFGEMSRLGNMCRPDIAVYTMIGNAHLEFLHDRNGVFRAKTEMLDYLPDNAVLIVNGDDDMLRKIDFPGRIIKFGLGRGCDIRAERIEKGCFYTDCIIDYDGRTVQVHIPAFGEHMIYAALEGAAVGMVCGLSDEEISSGIAAYKTLGRRAAYTDTGRIKLVDDSYNANPDSVKCGIDSIMHIEGRKVCILGDMLELGPDEKNMHFQMGEYAREKGAELVVCCGELSKYTAEGAGDRGVHFDTKAELMSALPELIKDGDVCLVKASLRSGFGEISEYLKKF